MALRVESDESTNIDSYSSKFGTPESLEEVRNLTDVGAMTRLLHECIAYQRGLDLELDTILLHRTDLDKQLSSLQKSAQVLDIVKADAEHLCANVSSTSLLADQVSAKVRQLDLAQSRVNDTLLRIDAIVDRSHCLDGVRKALDSEDYESAAVFVQTFLQLDAKYKDSAASDQREQLLASKKQLEGIVRRKLGEAVDKRDHSKVLRFIRLYPPLALEEEGLQVYVAYLKKVIAMRSRIEYEQLVEMMSDHRGNGQNEVNFVSCLTNLFKDIVLAIEENDETLRSLCGEDGIVYAICELQEECDSRGSTIIKKYMEYRKLAKVTSEINSYKSDLLSVGVEGPDPREIEVYLEEILSLTQLGEDYTGYMISKIRGLSSVDPELGPRATKAFRSGNFSKVVQDITGYYVILEGYFMVENVRKAIKIDELVFDSLTTSMVDDVFYVLQSCCRRSISTSNINSVIAVLSSAVSLLGGEYNEALQQKIREPNLGAKLFTGGVAVQKTGTEIATALNNMDVSGEYALKLRHEIEEQCAEVLTLLFNSTLRPNYPSNSAVTTTLPPGKLNSPCLCMVIIYLAISMGPLLTVGNNVSPNLAFLTWFRQDQLIQNALMASVEPTIAPTVAAANSSKSAWDTLHTTYANRSQTRVFSLRDQLARVTKESCSITEYLHTIRSLSDELATDGSPVSNPELIVKILGGLGPEFREISATIHARDTAVSYEELFEKLLDHELFLRHEDVKKLSSPITAAVAAPTKSNTNNRNNPRKNNNSQ
ncbi:Conserved oligomeric Golgi complex subunit 4 [Capsicum annuum]|nr:Conserved oligomeric Golgi complex subunit 4 [Capsicum annuum]